jgi:hypothetical protein
VIYRLKEPVEGREDLKVGQLMFEMRHSGNGKTVITDQGDGYGRGVVVTPGMVDRTGDFQATDFEALLSYILAGRMALPNVETLDPDDALNTIACGGSLSACKSIGHVKVGTDTHSRWAQVFLDWTQMGGLSGTGYAILYRTPRQTQVAADGQQPKWEKDWSGSGPAIVKFAICKHEVKAGANANPSRGWHPAHCAKCGLNMSVDSSD